MKICKVENCNSKHYALGYCNKHWRRFKNHGDPLFLVNPVVYDSDICKIEGCNKKRTSKGYCQTHYNRVLKYGDPTHCEATYHGMWGTPIYETWHNMIQRCYYEKCRMYYRYGGRGITVCEAWRKSFIAFYEDMGDRPFPKAQIDRINNDGNYEPLNCQWVGQIENMRNTSRTKLNTETVKEIRELSNNMEAKELSRKYNYNISGIYQIINNRIWREGKCQKTQTQ